MGSLFRLNPRRPDRAVHGYVYYRWTDRYISLVRWGLERTGLARSFSLPLGRHLERTHHAKVVSTDDARRMILVDKPVEWRDLEHVVPYDVARDIVLEADRPVSVVPCACRVVAEHRGDRDPSCGPVDTCLVIGDPLASFVVEHQAGARSVDATEALAIIEGASERGNVHTIWFKDAAGDRMYALCNCCSCCCIGLKSLRAGFSPVAASGYVARIDEARCTACGACATVCPFEAVDVAATVAVVDAAACMGCGACVVACPETAIHLEVGDGDVAPLPWERLG